MNAATVAALRELLGREDVIEAAARAEFNADQDPEYLITWDRSLSFVSKAYRDRVRAGFAAVLELAQPSASFPPPPVLSTITDDDRIDHPQPGDEPSEPIPPWVEGFALPPRIRVDPDLRTAP